MNADELYEQMKEALNMFGLSFYQKDSMQVEFKDGQVIFTYGNKSISIKADG